MLCQSSDNYSTECPLTEQQFFFNLFNLRKTFALDKRRILRLFFDQGHNYNENTILTSHLVWVTIFSLMHTHGRCSNVSLFKEASLLSSPSLHNRCRHRYRRRAFVCMRTHVPRDAFFHHAFLYLIVVTSHGLAHCQKVTFCINFQVELSTLFHNQAE